MAIETNVPSLPKGKHDGCEVVVVDAQGARNTMLVKVGGKVYTTRWRLDLASQHNMNDHIRRAWCKLSGVKLADLKAEIKKRRETEARLEVSREMESIKARAARMGYEVRKVR